MNTPKPLSPLIFHIQRQLSKEATNIFDQIGMYRSGGTRTIKEFGDPTN